MEVEGEDSLVVSDVRHSYQEVVLVFLIGWAGPDKPLAQPSPTFVGSDTGWAGSDTGWAGLGQDVTSIFQPF